MSGAGAAPSTVDETAQEEDEADAAKCCLCGARCATLLERGLHWELAEGDRLRGGVSVSGCVRVRRVTP